MRITKKMLIASVLFLFSIGPAYAGFHAGQFTKIYAFGDSLVDQGNVKIPVEQNCVELNAPVTNHTGGANPGRLWISSLASDLGIIPPGAILKPSSQGGPDFANSGGQTINLFKPLPDTFVGLNGKPKTITLPAQLPAFFRVHPMIQDPQHTLIVIWIGADDILDKIFNPNPAKRVAPAKVIVNGMSNIATALVELTLHGARNFLIIGQPNISLTPLASNPTTNPILNNLFLIGRLHKQASELQAACAAWNQALFSTANEPGLGPVNYVKNYFAARGIHLNMYVLKGENTIFNLLTRVTQNPASFGFPDIVPFFGSQVKNGEATFCQVFIDKHGKRHVYKEGNPDDYIYYNFIHPATKAHSLVGKDAFENATLF